MESAVGTVAVSQHGGQRSGTGPQAFDVPIRLLPHTRDLSADIASLQNMAAISSANDRSGCSDATTIVAGDMGAMLSIVPPPLHTLRYWASQLQQDPQTPLTAPEPAAFGISGVSWGPNATAQLCGRAPGADGAAAAQAEGASNGNCFKLVGSGSTDGPVAGVGELDMYSSGAHNVPVRIVPSLAAVHPANATPLRPPPPPLTCATSPPSAGGKPAAASSPGHTSPRGAGGRDTGSPVASRASGDMGAMAPMDKASLQEDALQTLRQIFDDQPQSDDDGRSPAAPPHPSGRAGTCHAPFNGEGIRGASPAGGHPTSATSGTEPLAAAAGGCGSAGGGFGAVAFVGSGSGEPSDSCGDASEFLQVNATQACDSPGGALLLKDGAFSSPLAAPQPTTAELLAAGRCSDRSGSSASYLANFQLPGAALRPRPQGNQALPPAGARDRKAVRFAAADGDSDMPDAVPSGRGGDQDRAPALGAGGFGEWGFQAMPMAAQQRPPLAAAPAGSYGGSPAGGVPASFSYAGTQPHLQQQPAQQPQQQRHVWSAAAQPQQRCFIPQPPSGSASHGAAIDHSMIHAGGGGGGGGGWAGGGSASGAALFLAGGAFAAEMQRPGRAAAPPQAQTIQRTPSWLEGISWDFQEAPAPPAELRTTGKGAPDGAVAGADNGASGLLPAADEGKAQLAPAGAEPAATGELALLPGADAGTEALEGGQECKGEGTIAASGGGGSVGGGSKSASKSAAKSATADRPAAGAALEDASSNPTSAAFPLEPPVDAPLEWQAPMQLSPPVPSAQEAAAMAVEPLAPLPALQAALPAASPQLSPPVPASWLTADAGAASAGGSASQPFSCSAASLPAEPGAQWSALPPAAAGAGGTSVTTVQMLSTTTVPQSSMHPGAWLGRSSVTTGVAVSSPAHRALSATLSPHINRLLSSPSGAAPAAAAAAAGSGGSIGAGPGDARALRTKRIAWLGRNLSAAVEQRRNDAISAVLHLLSRCQVDTMVLYETQIGPEVKALTKHDDANVRQLASMLLEKWQSEVRAALEAARAQCRADPAAAAAAAAAAGEQPNHPFPAFPASHGSVSEAQAQVPAAVLQSPVHRMGPATPAGFHRPMAPHGWGMPQPQQAQPQQAWRSACNAPSVFADLSPATVARRLSGADSMGRSVPQAQRPAPSASGGTARKRPAGGGSAVAAPPPLTGEALLADFGTSGLSPNAFRPLPERTGGARTAATAAERRLTRLGAAPGDFHHHTHQQVHHHHPHHGHSMQLSGSDMYIYTDARLADACIAAAAAAAVQGPMRPAAPPPSTPAATKPCKRPGRKRKRRVDTSDEEDTVDEDDSDYDPEAEEGSCKPTASRGKAMHHPAPAPVPAPVPAFAGGAAPKSFGNRVRFPPSHALSQSIAQMYAAQQAQQQQAQQREAGAAGLHQPMAGPAAADLLVRRQFSMLQRAGSLAPSSPGNAAGAAAPPGHSAVPGGSQPSAAAGAGGGGGGALPSLPLSDAENPAKRTRRPPPAADAPFGGARSDDGTGIGAPKCRGRGSLWTPEFEQIYLNTLREHGLDYGQLCAALPEKTLTQVKSFYFNRRHKMGLDAIIEQYAARKAAAASGQTPAAP